MFKTINLVGEEFGLQIDRNSDEDLVILRLNDFVVDEEKTKPGHMVFKESEVLEVYPDIDEVKEIIKALQNILPEEEKQNEPISFCGK